MILLTVPASAQYQDSQGTGQSIYACTVISKPGSYVLANNITATQRDLKTVAGRVPSCIVIVADFVSLDLHGYSITGPGLDIEAFGIYSTANASDKQPIATHVRNGSVTNFARGMTLEGAGHTVEQVRFVGNWAGVLLDGTGMRVKDVVAVSNSIGIFLWYGYGHSVEHCKVHSNLEGGIYMRDYDVEGLSSLPRGSRIVGNTVSDNISYGIWALCPSVILQNIAYNNGTDIFVIDVSACTQSDNNP